ncbi:MAG: hypothetical protein E7403_03655 [Ruminococcaceae bacterium]|nr:hypothetical protein [Oscillospiraceae bacterium]
MPLIVRILLYGWFIFAFYVIFSTIYNKYNEKKLYGVMIANPNDDTVEDYIEAFKSVNGFSAMLFGLYFRAQQASDRARQAQGYYIIEECPSVSQEVKEELRIVFLSNGVQIS